MQKNRGSCCKKCGERTTNTARHVSKHSKKETGRCRLSCNSCEFEAHDVCLIKSHGVKMHGDGNNYSDRKMESDFGRIRAQCFGFDDEGEADENPVAVAAAGNDSPEMGAETSTVAEDEKGNDSDDAEDGDDSIGRGNDGDGDGLPLLPQKSSGMSSSTKRLGPIVANICQKCRQPVFRNKIRHVSEHFKAEHGKFRFGCEICKYGTHGISCMKKHARKIHKTEECYMDQAEIMKPHFDKMKTECFGKRYGQEPARRRAVRRSENKRTRTVEDSETAISKEKSIRADEPRGTEAEKSDDSSDDEDNEDPEIEEPESPEVDEATAPVTDDFQGMEEEDAMEFEEAAQETQSDESENEDDSEDDEIHDDDQMEDDDHQESEEPESPEVPEATAPVTDDFQGMEEGDAMEFEEAAQETQSDESESEDDSEDDDEMEDDDHRESEEPESPEVPEATAPVTDDFQGMEEEDAMEFEEAAQETQSDESENEDDSEDDEIHDDDEMEDDDHRESEKNHKFRSLRGIGSCSGGEPSPQIVPSTVPESNTNTSTESDDDEPSDTGKTPQACGSHLEGVAQVIETQQACGRDVVMSVECSIPIERLAAAGSSSSGQQRLRMTNAKSLFIRRIKSKLWKQSKYTKKYGPKTGKMKRLKAMYDKVRSNRKVKEANVEVEYSVGESNIQEDNRMEIENESQQSVHESRLEKQSIPVQELKQEIVDDDIIEVHRIYAPSTSTQAIQVPVPPNSGTSEFKKCQECGELVLSKRLKNHSSYHVAETWNINRYTCAIKEARSRTTCTYGTHSLQIMLEHKHGIESDNIDNYNKYSPIFKEMETKCFPRESGTNQ